jgi:hypothetical protein
MLQAILHSFVVRLFAYIAWVVLYPVAVLVCTPFILIRAWILGLVHREKFGHAVSQWILRCRFFGGAQMVFLNHHSMAHRPPNQSLQLSAGR